MRAKEFLPEEKPLGIGGKFISGMTGGRATSLKGFGALGVASAADKLGFGNTAGNIRANIKPDTNMGPDDVDVNHLPPDMKNMSTQELADALGLKVGMVTNIGGQQVKIKALDSEGVDGIGLNGNMPVSYPKEALMMMLVKQQSKQQAQQPQQSQAPKQGQQ